METATFAGGCFWCIEAVFQRLKGVKTVVSGYAGGGEPDPTYDQVSSGTTGHVEAIQITFDPSLVSYQKLLEVFWQSHDPTSQNRQGPDHGEQYGAVIFFHDEKQRELAEKSRQIVGEKLDETVVTDIRPFSNFYKAESYHQNYYNNNRNAPYCRLVIEPKLRKLKL